jgi:hypothetical protein
MMVVSAERGDVSSALTCISIGMAFPAWKRIAGVISKRALRVAACAEGISAAAAQDDENNAG